MKRHVAAINTSLIGLCLLGVTIVLSLVVVVRNIIAIERPDRTPIRIAHWQLEAGYREAFDAVIADYEKLHPNVKIIQMPVTEKVYAQWINTQMISGTAPDLVEMGMSQVMLKDENTVRQFLSLGDEVGKPNPYNEGTDLEGVPWKETFIDGMRGGYRDTLQDYYMVPTSMIGMRAFVNATLLEKVGAKMPESMGELIDACQKVREYSFKERGGAIVPIVTSYSFGPLINPYQIPFMASLEPELDWDLDGMISQSEAYRGMVTEKISFQTPQIKAFFEAAKLLTDQMQKGFSSMDRQQAQFNFVNGNAAFYGTGSWDARGTFEAAKQKGIEVKLMQWPLPKPGERFAEYVIGRANEAASKGAGSYGVYKNTPHYDEAIDFLRYLTSKEGNQKFNQLSEWPPIIIGSEPAEIMKPFMPDPVGYTSWVNFGIGSKLNAIYQTELLSYLQGETSFQTMTTRYLEKMHDPRLGGDWAAWKEYDDRSRDCRNQERLLARDAVQELMAPEEYKPDRYKRTVLQQARRNNGREVEHRFELYRHQELPRF